MDFYWITERREHTYYNIVGGTLDQCLPSLLSPECGHRVWTGGGTVLPIDKAQIPGIEPYLKRYRKNESVSPEEWKTLTDLIATATSGTALASQPINPGMRIGPVDIVYTCRKDIPDVMWIPASYLFSDRLIQQLGPLKDVHVYPASARRKSTKQTVEQTAYYELQPLTTAKFAPVSEYCCSRCPICGQKLSETYRYSILDMIGLEDLDVVRGENGRAYYSERFKQHVEAAGVRALTFIPAWRMSSESDLSTVLYDMEFERQTGQPPDVKRPAGW